MMSVPFHLTARPGFSPWGQVDQATQVLAGIWSVQTPSHGGYIISQQRRDAMPAPLASFLTFAGGNAYEEDCDWAIVALAWPEVMVSDTHSVEQVREIALHTVRGSLAWSGLMDPQRVQLQAIVDWAEAQQQVAA